jgi:hypothetical protein
MMIENKALSLETMLRDYIIPHLKTKLNNSKEIAATLSDQDIQMIDAKFIKSETAKFVNDLNKQTILSGKIAEPIDEQAIMGQVQASLQEQGKQRFFKPSEVEDKKWAEIFDGIEYSINVEITNEASNKAERLATLTEMFQTIAKAPQILETPNGKLFFNKILEESSVVSPIQFNSMQPQQAPAIGGN